MTNRISDMPPETFSMRMHRMPLSDRAQTISHQKLIVSNCKYYSRNVNKDSDPAIVKVAESFTSKESLLRYVFPDHGLDSC